MGVANLIKNIAWPIIKFVAILVIASFVLAWMGIAITGHALTPYIPVISPEPVYSGYIGFYSGVLSLGVIPLIALCWLLFWLIWGFKVNPTFKRTTKAVWGLSFFIFLMTVVFTARSFSARTTTISDPISALIDRESTLNIEIDNLHHNRYDEDLLNLNFGEVLFDDDEVKIRDGIYVRFKPGTTEEISIVKEIKSHGSTNDEAQESAKHPDHKLYIEGNTLHIDDYYTLEKHEKFRGQDIRYTVNLPVGTKVNFEESSYIFRHYHMGWKYKDWVMGEDKLQAVKEEG